MKTAIFPGSFNPVHNGHINIIKLASQTYDKLYVYVANNESKQYFVSLNNRFLVVEKIIKYLGLKNVEVVKQKAGKPTPIFAKENDIKVVVRGNKQRHLSEYEARIADLYLESNPNLIFHYMTFTDDVNVSSTLVRNLIHDHKPIDQYVPKQIEKEIKELWAGEN